MLTTPLTEPGDSVCNSMLLEPTGLVVVTPALDWIETFGGSASSLKISIEPPAKAVTFKRSPVMGCVPVRGGWPPLIWKRSDVDSVTVMSSATFVPRTVPSSPALTITSGTAGSGLAGTVALGPLNVVASILTSISVCWSTLDALNRWISIRVSLTVMLSNACPSVRTAVPTPPEAAAFQAAPESAPFSSSVDAFTTNWSLPVFPVIVNPASVSKPSRFKSGPLAAARPAAIPGSLLAGRSAAPSSKTVPSRKTFA